MAYRVISRFYDRARGCYVDPGDPCPEISLDEAQRLVGAHCLEQTDGPPAPATPAAPDSPSAPSAAAAPAAPRRGRGRGRKGATPPAKD